MSARSRGLLMLAGGAALVGLQILLVASKVFTFEKHGRMVVSAGIVGGAFLIAGAIQAIVGEPWEDIVRNHKTVLQVIAFLVLAGIAVGIAVATS